MHPVAQITKTTEATTDLTSVAGAHAPARSSLRGPTADCLARWEDDGGRVLYWWHRVTHWRSTTDRAVS